MWTLAVCATKTHKMNREIQWSTRKTITLKKHDLFFAVDVWQSQLQAKLKNHNKTIHFALATSRLISLLMWANFPLPIFLFLFHIKNVQRMSKLQCDKQEKCRTKVWTEITMACKSWTFQTSIKTTWTEKSVLKPNRHWRVHFEFWTYDTKQANERAAKSLNYAWFWHYRCIADNLQYPCPNSWHIAQIIFELKLTTNRTKNLWNSMQPKIQL